MLLKTKDFDFSNGIVVGKIMTKVGLLYVKEISSEDQIAYGAFDKDKVLCVLGFLKTSDFLIAKNAVTDPTFVGKGIASELFYFVNKTLNNKILSDTQLTPSGELLWNSLVKSSKFDSKIYYLPTKETFEISDIGNKKTSDGETIISPKKDDFDMDFYDTTTTKKGKKFFYILESNIECTKTHKKMAKSKILLPYHILNEYY